MPKIITEQNLRALVDALAGKGTRVVAPRQSGPVVLYEPITEGKALVLHTLPRRSAKETFFPVCETILSFEKTAGGTKVNDVDPARFHETVLLAVRPCDAAGAPVLDAVFSWDYDDEFFLERRRKTTVIGLACTSCDEACFCSAVGLSPAERKGSDLFLNPLKSGGFHAEAVTEKGESILREFSCIFEERPDVSPLPPAEPKASPLDLPAVKGWLDANFENALWEETAEICAGCGTCAFVCPACHCFDIVDEGSPEKGVRRKSWDACAFSKFTIHASSHNPREVQPQRYRQRIMHKFKYYDDKFGQTLCTGCGRCIRACPVGIDIKGILDEIQKKGAGG